MERPINAKQRENAILIFALACFISLLLLGYHAIITTRVISKEMANVPEMSE